MSENIFYVHVVNSVKKKLKLQFMDVSVHYYYGLARIIGDYSVLEGGIKEDELLLYKANKPDWYEPLRCCFEMQFPVATFNMSRNLSFLQKL